MKGLLILFLGAFLTLPVRAQTPAENAAIQGDQEIFWAIKLFKEHYTPQTYPKYTGKVKLIDDKNLQFDNKSVEYLGADSLKAVFTVGILYPQLLGPGEPRVLALTEAFYVSCSPQKRKFRMDVVHKGYNNSQGWATNPTIYFFELTNKKATAKTSVSEFIKGAALTFLKEGWIQK